MSLAAPRSCGMNVWMWISHNSVTVHVRSEYGREVIAFLEHHHWHVRRLVPGSPTQLMTFIDHH
jgi:hypothetical protein